ncbi:MAG: translocation/assembly module TamB domain-containing protein [Sneathiellaceae bacterium]
MSENHEPETAAAAPRRRSRRGRVLRVLGAVLAGLLILPVILAAGVLVWVNTDAGRGWIVERVARATAGSEAQVRIGRLEPGLPGAVEVRDLSIADDQGVWLTLAEARLAWNPWQLLSGTLRIDNLTGRALTVARIPGADGAEEADSAPFDPANLLPDLPVSVSVGEIDLREIVLQEPVAGVPARLDAKAQLAVAQGAGAEMSVDIRRTDGVGGVLTARADIAPGDTGDRLDLDVTLSEPPGGLIAGLAGWPDTAPVDLRISGKGPLGALDGTIAGSVGNLAKLGGGFRATYEEATYSTVLALELTGEIAGLLPEDVRPLAPGALRLGLELRSAGGGEALDLRKLSLSSDTLALNGTASVDLASGPIAAELTVDRLDPAALQAFVPDLQLAEPRLTLKLTGSLDAPVADLRIDAKRLALGEIAVRDLSATASARPDGTLSDAGLPPFDIAVEARAGAVEQADPAAAQLLQNGLSLTLAGRVDPTAESLKLDSARIVLPSGSLVASGTASAAGPADLQAIVEIPDLAALGGAFGLPLQGGLQADLRAGGADLLAEEPGAWTAELTARLDRFGFDDLPLQPLLGESVTLAAEASGQGSRSVALSQLRLQGAQLTATGGGRADLAGETLQADLQVAIAELDALSGLAGTPMSGSAGLQLTLAGPLAAPGLSAELRLDDAELDGTPVTARLTATAAQLAMPMQVALDLTGRAMALPLTVHTDLDLAADGSSLTLRNLRGDVAGAVLDGALAVNLDSSLADGRLNLAVADLSPLAARFGTALEGKLTGTVTLAPRPAGQAVLADVTVAGLAMPGDEPEDEEAQAAAADAAADRAADLAADGAAAPAAAMQAEKGAIAPLVAAESARLQADMVLAAGGPRGSLSLTLTDVVQAEARLRNLVLRADGDLATRMQVTLEASGEMQVASEKRPLSLSAEAALQGLPPDLGAELSGIRLALGDTAIRQQGSARITMKGDTTALAGLRLDVDGGGSLMADATAGPAAIDADIQVDGLPLALAGLFVEDMPVLGMADLSAELRLRPGRPQGRASLTLSDLRSDKEEYQSLPPASVAAQAALSDGRLQLAVDWKALGDEPGRLTLAMPLRSPAGALLPEPDRAAPVTGALNWAGDLGQLGLFLPVDSEIAGRFQADLTIGGTLANPRVPGRIQISDGSYRNYTTGTIVTGLQARVDGGEDGRLDIAAEAGDSEGGRLRMAGHIELSADPLPTFEVKLTTERFVAARLDLATATISADLTAAGTPLRNKVEGDVTVERLAVQIDGGLPASATVIPVVVVPRPGAAPLNPREAETDPRPSRTRLDITVTIPPRMTVSGRGLDSTWSGNLRVSASTSNPRVTGQITAVRGEFNLVGKRFELAKGVIGFDGARPPDPNIDIELTYTGESATASIVISGTANDPKLNLTSVPQMPESDIISTVLFNRRTGQLSAAEALEVATSLAALTGQGAPGAGITSQVRDALGLDVLSIGSSTDGSPALNAGRYITDNVYVGVRQGLSTSSSSVAVQVDLTDNIQLETDVGADSNSTVGVNWKFDY